VVVVSVVVRTVTIRIVDNIYSTANSVCRSSIVVPRIAAAVIVVVVVVVALIEHLYIKEIVTVAKGLRRY